MIYDIRYRLVHTPNGEICVCGHSVRNDENEAKYRYFYSVWDLNTKKCIREIDLEEAQADFCGEFECVTITTNGWDGGRLKVIIPNELLLEQ